MDLPPTVCCSSTGSRAARAVLQLGVAALVLACSVFGGIHGAWAAETLEMDAAAGGPPGPGDVITAQAVTFRRNIDNPGGNTFAAMANPLTVTYALSNQRFPGAGSQTTFGTSGEAPYQPLNLLANTASQFTSTGTGGATGVGIDLAANAGIHMYQYSAGIAAQSLPIGRVPMVDLTLTFSRPVDNPVIHVSGLGGIDTLPFIDYTTEFDLISPGTLTLLSGSANLVVAGNQINNTAALPDFGLCNTGETGCGSVRVNGVGLTSVTLTMFLRSGSISAWTPNAVERLGMSVSVDLPPQLILRVQSYGTTSTVNFTGTNGLPSQNLQTTTPGVPVVGPMQVLAIGSQTVVTQSVVTGPALTAVSCINPGTGAAVPGVSVSLPGGTVVLDGEAVESGAQVQCTYVYGVAPAVTPVPTLGQWALVLLSLALMAIGAPMLRRL